MDKLLQNRKVLIGVCGGIAAYKVAQVVSSLVQAGAIVQVIVTDAAAQFVTPLTFATLSRSPAYTDADFWQPVHGRPLHIALGEWADVFLIAPLTANTLGKLVYGLADNLLTNTVLASTCPVLLAPAMNTDMWEQVPVQNNWQKLMQDRRFHGANPGAGMLACERVGAGRMAEPEELCVQLQSLLHTGGQRDLVGKRVLINAGGTREFLDPVRFIGNPSTGKMGVALAQAALLRGAAVTLVHGAIESHYLVSLSGARLCKTVASDAMYETMQAEFASADLVVFCAAVADVKPAEFVDRKLPKSELPSSLSLAPVLDIAATISQQRQPHQRLIGFAAQTGDIVAPAQAKLQRKGLDAIVANPVDQVASGFGSDTNQAVILAKNGQQQAILPCSKLAMAHQIWDFVRDFVLPEEI
ncbi:bifunctional phosphopantothenoylcysteine decarboxylase/phosphopantothenate--cysteine ligase CoaBC [filamentous cyanobacterium LEGE 11480]|uniref:Coenzyme A biosynthesis bifunctional protein CoaBC n=1 Tax=Romeriopsis navalis LEGE 11480 TaxID=2777977 RepID=A0A928Z728_9CYAN|nr:bifunctional phosphopantothenoylcysteine decarboxylase/phosphopantothenate--cysteine ligase CoaBC [Romeriopsis navalis]MBE9032795.1 bifunctional phosphopantothenoylcysteine decarboxylase/phosphopantothenate--cysteine ligase CoaBC [Romeriopsis navalis LEGE 11480]